MEENKPRLRSIDIMTLLSPRLVWRLLRGMVRSVVDEKFSGWPLAVCWFTNFSCNARCSFCCKAAEIRAGRSQFPPLSLDDAERLLTIIHRKVDLLYLSGGEPLINPHIIDICRTARQIGFSSIGISSNLIALEPRAEILEYVDAIGVSLHAPNPAAHAGQLNVSLSDGQRVFANLEMLKQFSSDNRIRVVINCVITPANLDHIIDMVAYTAENGFLLEVVPANEHGHRPRGLHQNPRYLALIDQLIELRRSGQAPHLAGSSHYYQTIRDFKPFRCFPYGVANILPDGRLCTPCDISEQYSVNLLDHTDLSSAIRASLPHLGNYPCQAGKCFKAGIIERSHLFGLLVEHRQPDFA